MKTNKSKALQYWELSAEKGHNITQLIIGVIYAQGIEVEKDINKAKYYLSKASENGNIKAQLYLAQLYFDEKNYKEAINFFRKAANQNNKTAKFKLARMYEAGEGVEKDLDEAIKLYKESTTIEMNEVQNSIGIEFYNNEEYNKAFEYYQEAAKKGNMYGQYNLGLLYLQGLGVTKDSKEAFEWLRKSAEQGNREAQNQLGNMYFNGDGVEKNIHEAMKWAEKSAQQGNTNSQNNLGVIYNMGEIVPRNLSEAIKWFKKSAEQGHETAQYNLAYIYSNEKGYINKEEALRFYTLSAERGNINSMYELYLIYLKGDDVEKNLEKAEYWRQKAIENGYIEGDRGLNNLKGMLLLTAIISPFFILHFLLLLIFS